MTLRRPEHPGTDAPAFAEAPTLAELREAILRRIMRAACIAGALAMALAVLFVRPFETRAALVGGAALAVVFASTLLPRRLGVLSVIYPWMLTLTGSGLALTMGPKAEPFLFLCGGFFIGSLVLETRTLALLSLFALAATVAAIDLSGQSFVPPYRAAWLNGLTSLLSVAVPASIAGRMLVNALASALAERTALLRNLLEESRIRESTTRALEATRTQLTHAQKMELVGQMAGGIAHDMNNALTAILGGASLLSDGAGEMRELIQEAAAHAAKLTHQLMVFSRRDTSQPRPIDLSATIAEQLKAIVRLLTSEVTLSSELPNEPVPVLADPTHVLQVLLNLTSNAKDAMPTGGTLSIVLQHERDAREAVIAVSDSGAGIGPALLPQVFEPFFTTKPAGKGTGLGLANVKQLIEAMGGSVAVESELDRGTTFRLRIPTTNEPVRRQVLETRRPSERSGTILVVDDDVRVRATLYVALERMGFNVLEASSPETVEALLARSTVKLDLLCTDVVLAGGGGARVIELVRGKFSDARVLVMSGYNDDETLRRGIARGAFPFIAKPFTAEALGLAVDEALAGKRLA